MHNAQGQQLPSFTGLEGEWISKPDVFLYRAVKLGPADERIPMQLEFEDDTRAIGFALDQLAAELGVTEQEVIEANQAGTLLYLGAIPVAPKHGRAIATDFQFQIGDRWGFITLEDESDKGTN